jgi:hypothetical protein
MAFLKFFSKSAPKLVALPRGSFTVDRQGRILISTLPQLFPTAIVKDISEQVLAAFRAAQAAKSPLTELIIRYPTLKLTARELRGGAIIFLVPQTLSSPTQ